MRPTAIWRASEEAMIDETGVFNSCDALATKSRRIEATRSRSVTSTRIEEDSLVPGKWSGNGAKTTNRLPVLDHPFYGLAALPALPHRVLKREWGQTGEARRHDAQQLLGRRIGIDHLVFGREEDCALGQCTEDHLQGLGGVLGLCHLIPLALDQFDSLLGQGGDGCRHTTGQ